MTNLDRPWQDILRGQFDLLPTERNAALEDLSRCCNLAESEPVHNEGDEAESNERVAHRAVAAVLRLRQRCCEALAQLDAINKIVGLDMVSIGGAPAVEMETPLIDRVRILRYAASAEADEANRLRDEVP